MMHFLLFTTTSYNFEGERDIANDSVSPDLSSFAIAESRALNKWISVPAHITLLLIKSPPVLIHSLLTNQACVR